SPPRSACTGTPSARPTTSWRASLTAAWAYRLPYRVSSMRWSAPAMSKGERPSRRGSKSASIVRTRLTSVSALPWRRQACVSPTPTIPSSVWTLTMSTSIVSRGPPCEILNGAAKGTRSGIGSILVIFIAHLRSSAAALLPEFAGGQARALPERAQPVPDGVGVDLDPAREGPEAAVDSGHDVLAPDHARIAGDALGHQLGMLDEVGGGVDHPGYQHLALGQVDFLPHLPLVLVPRVGPGDHEG